MVTIRKIPISSIILLLGLVFCFTNGFADENNGFADDILIPGENIDDFQVGSSCQLTVNSCQLTVVS